MEEPTDTASAGGGDIPGATTRRVTTYRKVEFLRPHRVVRSPEETASVWVRRSRSFLLTAVVWALLTIVFAATGARPLLVVLTAAAAVLSFGVVIKGRILVSQAEKG